MTRPALAEMGKRGQRYAVSHLTWRPIAEAMLECYTEVLSGAGKSSRQMRHTSSSLDLASFPRPEHCRQQVADSG